jgi:hypothetical protein
VPDEWQQPQDQGAAPSPYNQPPYSQPPYSQPYGAPGAYGQPYGAPVAGYGMAPTTSGRATAVLVLGISSLVLLFMCGLGLVTAIVALVMAPGAKRDITGSQGRLTGLGMVQGGVVCSWITVALVVVFAAVLVLLLAVGASFGDLGSYSTF